MNNQITICTAVSPDWLKYTVIQLHSILKNNTSNSPIKFYVFTDTEDVTEKHIDMFRKLVDKYKYTFDILFVDVKEAFDKLVTSQNNVSERYKRHALYRLFIPQLLTEDKVLYLDSDTIVCQDLSKLFNLDMKDWYVGACRDTGITNHHKSDIGMNPEWIYFNSGVLLLNNKLLIQERMFDRFLDRINGEPLLGVDQDILNLEIGESFTELNPIYNVSLSTDKDVPTEYIKVLHHAGMKPWDTTEAFGYHIWKQYHDEVFESTTYEHKGSGFYKSLVD